MKRRVAQASSRETGPTRLGWRVGRFIGFIVLTMGVVGTGLYQIHERHKLVELGYLLDEDRFEFRRQLETKKRLELALSAHKDPNAVHAIATDRLGMRPATQTDEFRVPDSEAVEAVEEGEVDEP